MFKLKCDNSKRCKYSYPLLVITLYINEKKLSLCISEFLPYIISKNTNFFEKIKYPECIFYKKMLTWIIGL